VPRWEIEGKKATALAARKLKEKSGNLRASSERILTRDRAADLRGRKRRKKQNTPHREGITECGSNVTLWPAMGGGWKIGKGKAQSRPPRPGRKKNFVKK